MHDQHQYEPALETAEPMAGGRVVLPAGGEGTRVPVEIVE